MELNRYPLHVTAHAALPGGAPVQPGATRAGNTLNLDLTPFGDNNPGDTGSGYGLSCAAAGCAGRYVLYQNGVQIAGGNAVKAAEALGSPDLSVQARLSPRPSRLRLVLTASRPPGRYPLSAASRDVWTWHTARQPGVTLPAPWYCTFVSADNVTLFRRHCAVQPMIMLRYRVARLSLSGSTRPGSQAVTITAVHLPLADAPPVTAARASVSVDDGRTWRPVRLRRLAPGRFRAAFTASPGRAVTLRVTAADRAGDALTETIQRAWQVSRR